MGTIKMDTIKNSVIITTLFAPVSINAASLNASALISGTNDVPGSGTITVNESFSGSGGSVLSPPGSVSISQLASFKGVGQTGTTLGVVNVDGADDGSFNVSAFGQGNHLNEARFQFSELITNSATDALTFNMDFLISAGELSAKAYEVTQQGDEFLQAEYGISISFGGLELFQSSAILRQVEGPGEFRASSTLQLTGTSLNGVYSPGSSSDFDNEALYTWNDFNGNLQLGLLSAGESKLLEYDVFVRGSGEFDMCGSSGCGATNASIGDPFSFSSEISPASISSVPVPAAAWLFGSGLLGLIGVSRRSKKSNKV